MKETNNKKTTSENEKPTLYPVIMAVPEVATGLSPRERVKFLSHQARQALAISAEKSRVTLGKLLQDERNAPLPCDGTYWSLTHKTAYVGGVVAANRMPTMPFKQLFCIWRGTAAKFATPNACPVGCNVWHSGRQWPH